MPKPTTTAKTPKGRPSRLPTQAAPDTEQRTKHPSSAQPHSHKSPNRSPVQDNEDDDEKPDTNKIPLVSAIDDEVTMTLATELLVEAEEVKERHDIDEVRLKEIRLELTGLAKAFELPGMRYGNIAVVYSGERTKKTLDAKLLIENGVDPDIIRKCYKESKPFDSSRIIKIPAR
jgi:hypothetical protein